MADEATAGQSEGTGNPTGGAPAGEQAGGSTPFYSGFENAELSTWAEGKGWRSPEAVVKSAFHLEKMVGAPAESVLRVPVSGDTEGWAKVHQQLGAPAEASGYEVPMKGGDAETGALRELFHKAGLTQDQAKAIVEGSEAFGSDAEQAAEEAYAQTVQVQEQELHKEWGAGYDRQMSLAQNAAGKLGFDENAINGLESTLGYAETVKLMANLGTKLGEDNFVNGDHANSQNGFQSQLTPAQAKVKWSEFSGDPNSRTALLDKRHPGHDAAMTRKRELFSLMHPDA